MAEFPTIEAKNLADLNDFRFRSDHFVELSSGRYFALLEYCSSAQFRASAYKSLIHPGDILTQYSALWIHTGLVTPQLAQGPFVVRRDSRHRTSCSRRKIPVYHTVTLAGVELMSVDRTVVELLVADLESGISNLPKLVRAGATYDGVENVAKEIHSVPGKRRLQAILRQLPRDIFIFNTGETTKK